MIAADQPSITSVDRRADWELDFYSRPIMEPDGKKRWELLVSSTPPLSGCLLYTSPSPRDRQKSRMPSSA